MFRDSFTNSNPCYKIYVFAPQIVLNLNLIHWFIGLIFHVGIAGGDGETKNEDIDLPFLRYLLNRL